MLRIKHNLNKSNVFDLLSKQVNFYSTCKSKLESENSNTNINLNTNINTNLNNINNKDKNKNSKLLHVHVPGLNSYNKCSQIQDYYVRKWLDWKKNKSNSDKSNEPLPVVFTMEMHPVYTTGRRDIKNLKLLETIKESINNNSNGNINNQVEIVKSLRGGQTTFHGPGQLVAYIVLDIFNYNISPKCYVNILEKTIINTCKQDPYNINSAHQTENNGVWVDKKNGDGKIAALGIHIRRGITSHGIALNVTTDLSWFDKIIACGLPTKHPASMFSCNVPMKYLSVESVGDAFVKQFSKLLHFDSIEKTYYKDTNSLIK